MDEISYVFFFLLLSFENFDSALFIEIIVESLPFFLNLGFPFKIAQNPEFRPNEHDN